MPVCVSSRVSRPMAIVMMSSGLIVMKTLWKRLKRFTLGLLIFLLVFGLIGATYQNAASKADEKNFPAPGQFVDVGGFKMHLYCVGEGSLIVILEALSGGFSYFWGWVQPEVAKQVRV